jgi:hypothetical protein
LWITRPGNASGLGFVGVSTAAVPVLLPDDISDETASLVARIGAGSLHPVYLAAQHKAVLLSDDAVYRSLARQLVGLEALWLQPVLMAATRRDCITVRTYANAVVGLAAHRHGHVSIASVDLLKAYENTDRSLHDFRTLATRLGGSSADLLSHCNVVLGVLAALWRQEAVDPLKLDQGALSRFGHHRRGLQVLEKPLPGPATPASQARIPGQEPFIH